MQSLPKHALTATLVMITTASSSAWADFVMDMPKGVTEISESVFDLHRTILTVCTVIAIVVFGAMFYSMFKHRKSVGHKPAQFHESTAVEIFWTVVPFLILIAMAIPATKVLVKMDDTSDSALTVQVTGSQWKWHYKYIDYEGEPVNLGFLSERSTPMDQTYTPALSGGLFPMGVEAGKDSAAGNEARANNEMYNMEVNNKLVIPTGKKVRFLITSDDVIHSWWVPDFGIKKDAIPGFINELWTLVPEGKETTYYGQCAELCGKNHAYMPVIVEAKSSTDFEQWLADAQEAQRKAEEAAASSIDATFSLEEQMAEGEKAYVAKCAACHQANGAGLPPTFPALAGSAIATGPVEEHINIVRHGKNAMPPFDGQLSPREMSAIITYERNAWGNDTGDVVQPRQVVDQ